MTFQNFLASRTRSGSVSVRQVIQSRRDRNAFFPAHLFADPAWDILLELYAARLDQQRVSTSEVCERSAVPPTTALRWIIALEVEGLIERRPDPLDRRRVFISLSAKGADGMQAYFDR
jgi:DNA-binding MarR family transcriptional regulator